MRLVFFVFLFVLALNKGQAQNLVPNGSFEAHISCPTGGGDFNKVIPWISATLGGSPDCWDSCWGNVPNANMGFQYAINGHAFAGLYAYEYSTNSHNLREYIQSSFVDSMIASHTYNILFYVGLCDDCGYSVNKMAALISDSAVYGNDTSYLPYIPQIESATFLSDTMNWMQISGYYQAHGGEKYITIGNFRSDSLTDTLRVNNFGYPFAYYYIDSVTVIDCTATGIQELQEVYFTLLQNPVSNSVCFTSPVQLQRATVYNLVGEAVKEQMLTATNNYKIDVADLPCGIYFLQVETRDKRKGVRKFVKQ